MPAERAHVWSDASVGKERSSYAAVMLASASEEEPTVLRAEVGWIPDWLSPLAASSNVCETYAGIAAIVLAREQGAQAIRLYMDCTGAAEWLLRGASCPTLRRYRRYRGLAQWVTRLHAHLDANDIDFEIEPVLSHSAGRNPNLLARRINVLCDRLAYWHNAGIPYSCDPGALTTFLRTMPIGRDSGTGLRRRQLRMPLPSPSLDSPPPETP